MQETVTKTLPVAELETERLQLSDLPPKKKKKTLNPKQRKFLKNYTEGEMSATDAYEDAYDCDDEYVRTRASRLLATNDNIIAAVEEYVELERKAASLRLGRKQDKAAEILGDALESADENIQVRAAKDILDRTGHKPKTELEHSGGLETPIVFNFGGKLVEDDI